MRVLVEGQERATVEAFTDTEAYLEAYAAIVDTQMESPSKAKALAKDVREKFEVYGKLNTKIAEEVVSSVTETKDPAKLSDIIAVHLNAEIKHKQDLLAEPKVIARLKSILGLD